MVTWLYNFYICNKIHLIYNYVDELSRVWKISSLLKIRLEEICEDILSKSYELTHWKEIVSRHYESRNILEVNLKMTWIVSHLGN